MPAQQTESEPEVLEGRARALRSSAVQAQAYHQLWKDERETRDALIVELVDAGNGVGQVAKWALVSFTRVEQVIAERG